MQLAWINSFFVFKVIELNTGAKHKEELDKRKNLVLKRMLDLEFINKDSNNFLHFMIKCWDIIYYE